MVSLLNTRMCFTRAKSGSAVDIAAEPTNADCAIPPMVPSVANIGSSQILVFTIVAILLVAMAATRVVECKRWVTHAFRLTHDATLR